MPRGDRTGPIGMGPMTGRQMGICTGYPESYFRSDNPYYGSGQGMGFRRGFNRGMGFGRGFNRGRGGFGGYWGYPSQPFKQQDEAAYLEMQAKDIEEDLTRIKSRLEELKKSKDQPEEK